jgi:hypothetical protein
LPANGGKAGWCGSRNWWSVQLFMISRGLTQSKKHRQIKHNSQSGALMHLEVNCSITRVWIIGDGSCVGELKLAWKGETVIWIYTMVKADAKLRLQRLCKPAAKLCILHT